MAFGIEQACKSKEKNKPTQMSINIVGLEHLLTLETKSKTDEPQKLTVDWNVTRVDRWTNHKLHQPHSMKRSEEKTDK